MVIVRNSLHLQKAFSSICSSPSGNDISANPLPSKADPPILFKLLGSSTLDKEMHSLNKPGLRVSMFVGKVTLLNLSQCQKTKSPNDSSFSGKLASSNSSQALVFTTDY